MQICIISTEKDDLANSDHLYDTVEADGEESELERRAFYLFRSS